MIANGLEGRQEQKQEDWIGGYCSSPDERQ